jgi:hypothetical protein
MDMPNTAVAAIGRFEGLGIDRVVTLDIEDPYDLQILATFGFDTGSCRGLSSIESGIDSNVSRNNLYFRDNLTHKLLL